MREKTSVLVQGIDITEDSIENEWGTYEPVVRMTSKTSDGNLKIVTIKNIPHEIFVACTEEFASDPRNVRDIADSLDAFLLKNHHACRRTDCENGCRVPRNEFSVSREMCIQHRSRDIQACLGADVQYRVGYETYEETPRSFIRLFLKGAYYAQEAYKFLKTVNTGNVLPQHAGVYDVVSDSLRSFSILKSWGAYRWFKFDVNDDGTKPRYEIDFNDLICIEENEMMKMRHAPLVSVFLDIENVSKIYLESETKKLLYPVGLVNIITNTKAYQFIFKGDGAKGVSGYREPDKSITTEILIFDTEAEMLIAFYRKFMEIDPDMVLGYNSNNFDIPYLLRRSQKLGFEMDLSRIRGCPTKFLETIQVIASGKRDMTKIECPGRVFIDVYRAVMDDTTVRLYDLKLGTVGEHYGVGGKEEGMDYEDIHPSFHGTEETRGNLCTYNAKDTFLVMGIEKRMNLIMAMMAKTIAQTCNSRELIERGISHRMSTNTRQNMRGTNVKCQWGVEYVNTEHVDPATGIRTQVSEKKTKLPYSLSRVPGYVECFEKKIEGGFVRDPDYKAFDLIEQQKEARAKLRKWQKSKLPETDEIKRCKETLNKRVPQSNRRFHKQPVVTFDFNSLYPSLCRHFNICPTTLMYNTDGHKEGEYNVAPNGFMFSKKKEGVCPRRMKYYMEKRLEVKAAMKDETDPDILMQLDALQTAYKLCANGMYGLYASDTGDLSCKPAAWAITSWGQQYQKMVTDRILSEKQFAYLQPEIVYGDTDSVFIKLNALESVEACRGMYTDEEWVELQRNLDKDMIIEVILQNVSGEVELASFPDKYLKANTKKQKYETKIVFPGNKVSVSELRRALYRASYENELDQFVFASRIHKWIGEDGRIQTDIPREEARRMYNDNMFFDFIVERYVLAETTRKEVPKLLKWVNVTSGMLTGVMKVGFDDAAFLWINDKKKYFKLVFSQERGDCVTDKMKVVGITNRSMTPFLVSVVKEAAKRKMVYNEDIRPFLFDALQKIASNLVPKKQLKHTSNLSKPIEEYAKNGQEGTERHVVAARQLRDIGKPVVVGDRVEFYYCLVTGLSDSLKNRIVGEQTVAAALVDDYNLDLRMYVRECIKAFDIFHCVLPDSPERLFPMSSLCFAQLTMKEMPCVKIELDKYMVRTKAVKRTIAQNSGKSAYHQAPCKRQMTLFERSPGTVVEKKETKKRKKTEELVRPQKSIQDYFNKN